jgi:hypothetical protein
MTEHYRTERGSRVEISGKHRGITSIVFDWFEEGACSKAKHNIVVEGLASHEPMLFWSCECCIPGTAVLFRCEP